MKILFVNQTYLPDVASTAQFLGDVATALARAGHEVTVVCANRNYLDNTAHRSEERIDDVRVLRATMFGFTRAGRVRRMLSALSCNISLLWKLLSAPRADVIVALTSPPLIAWFALLPARLRGARLVYWVMDINPEQAIRAGWLSRDSLPARLVEGALRQVLKAAHTVIVLDRYMAELLESKAPGEVKPVVMQLWDRQTSAPPSAEEIAAFRERQGLTGKFVVMYAGNHSICHPLDTMLEAARLLRDDREVVFAFMGGGARTDEVRRYREAQGLENIMLIGYQDEEAVGAALAAADLQVVIMGEPFVGVVHPSKIYRILGLGLPFVLIGPDESAIGDLIRATEVGTRIDHGDAPGLVRLIARLRRLSANERRMLGEAVLDINPGGKPLEQLVAALTEGSRPQAV